MSLLHGKTKRRILPRWRDSQRVGLTADIQSQKAPRAVKANVTPQLLEQAENFRQIKNIGTAAEFVSTALLAGKPEEALHAASFILERQDDVPNTLIQLAKSVTEGAVPFQATMADPGRQIARTRHLLRLQPNNPVLWSDMARHYASLGDRREALRCMKTAHALAPEHRWMLRTYSRFLVHQEEPIAAHKLLANHPRTRQDPWLIAAELACAQVADRAPKYWRQATDILRFNSVAPLHISELAIAVAMMELEAGDRKRAKRLVQKGLIAPTENTLAQVFWAKENRHLNDGLELEELVRSTCDAYEADYQLNMINGDLLGALNAAQTWSIDEPFAARPCAEIAYVASLLDDHETTIRMAARVKQLDGRSDPSLELNAIYARLSSGKLDKIKHATEIKRIKTQLLASIKQADGNSYHAVANLGLWFYRFGHPELGHETYQNAIAIAQKTHQNDAAAMAATFAAREAILAKDLRAATILQQAKDLLAKAKIRAGDFYLRKLDALAEAPDKAKEILSPSSTKQFLVNKKPQSKSVRMERTKNGSAILWIEGK